MTNKYTVNFYINRFKKIPHTKLTVGTFEDENGRKCAMGHCGSDLVEDTVMAKTLNNLCEDNLGHGIADINDGECYIKGVSGKGPRARVLSALELIKKNREKGNTN